MKRILFSVVLVNVLSTFFWGMSAWAEGEATPTPSPFICPTELYGEAGQSFSQIQGSEPTQDELEQISTIQSSAAGRSVGTCGDADNNGFLEKGDCTREGKVVTEIQEVLGNEIPEDQSVEGAFILNVYRGSCCLVTNSDLTCITPRSFYTENTPTGFETCRANSNVACERRQWIIGGSGMGLIKVYAKQIYTFAALSVGSVAVGNMVYSGVMITLTGSSGDISAYRDRITQAILALVLLFASGAILYAVNPTFFG